MSLKCVQSFRISIHLNLFIELRKAEGATKLKISKREKCQFGSEASFVAKGQRIGDRQDMFFF